MTIKDIAVKNLLRRKAKAAFVFAGLVIGVAVVVAVVSFADSMTHEIHHKLEKYGANILIVPRTDNLALTYGGITLGGVSFDMEPILESQLGRINTIKNAANIAAAGPITLGTVQVNRQTVLLAGVDFNAVGTLKPWWKIKGRIPAGDEVLIGADAAELLGLKPQQTVVLNGRSMHITGTLASTGSQDDQLLFAPLHTAQSILGKPGRISMVEVAALCNACPIDEMVRQIAGKLPTAKVMAVQQVVKGRMATLAQFRKFSYGLSALVVLIGGLVVLVTLMGSVKERTEEIGIFRAIGFRKRHVMGIIFIETGLISGIAGVVGYAAGLGGAWAGSALFGSAPATVPWSPMLAAGAIAMALAVGLLAGIYPAVTAARMDPNQALKTI